MRIETIGKYNYLVEYWYDKTKHRNAPSRIRISDKLADWLKTNTVDIEQGYDLWDEENERMQWSEWVDVDIPGPIKTEWRAILESDFPGPNTDIREQGKWRRQWAIDCHDLARDDMIGWWQNLLAQEKGMDEMHGTTGRMEWRRTQLRRMRRRIEHATPAWKAFFVELREWLGE
nr:hypothetical protein [Candidatus Sigynarchaeota archaeon]